MAKERDEPVNQPDPFDFPESKQEAELNQAMGMVAFQMGTSPENALALMQAHAFAYTTSLRSVVVEVLARRLVFSYDEWTEIGRGPRAVEP